jgi:proline dehydrogenase
MEKVIPMEVKASKSYNFNLGIKLIRGAYMNEERTLAEEQGRESPVWDTIEETHKCYDTSMMHIIKNMKHDDQLFVASHNTDTCELAMALVEDLNLKDKDCVRFGQLRGFSDQVTGDIAA